jgi:hypothetical protein
MSDIIEFLIGISQKVIVDTGHSIRIGFPDNEKVERVMGD